MAAFGNSGNRSCVAPGSKNKRKMLNFKKKILIIFAVGSNENQKSHVAMAKRQLANAFEDIRFAPDMWTKPIGLPHSKPFLNTVGVTYVHVVEDRVLQAFRDVERRCGRTVARSRRGEILIDVDLLFYEDHFCHEEDWDRDYIRQLVRELKSYLSEEEWKMLAEKIKE